MTTHRRRLTSLIIVLIGILLSTTMLFAQEPSYQRHRGRTNRPKRERFIPDFIGQQVRKFRLNFHKKPLRHRYYRDQHFNNKNNNCYNTRVATDMTTTTTVMADGNFCFKDGGNFASA